MAQRWIVARLRHRRFFSLAELNTAIRDLVDALNDRVTRHLGASRRQLFEDLERPALKPLPAAPYVYAQWQERTVGLDYHVEIDRHHYSVPHRLLREKVWARVTEKTVEIFHDGQRVAAHLRSPPDRRHTTVRDHGEVLKLLEIRLGCCPAGRVIDHPRRLPPAPARSTPWRREYPRRCAPAIRCPS